MNTVFMIGMRAMRTGQGAHLLFSDQLRSTSVVIDASGQVVEEGYYMPWGGERGNQEIELTDYGYTGQMKEGDIYFYNARWYDPQLGRFMQADTIVPLQVQGTQGFDRYAYVNNNPLRYTDPSGHCVGPLLVVCIMVGTWIVENAAVVTAIALTGAIVSYVYQINPDPVLMNDPAAAQEALDQANKNVMAWLTLGETTLRFGQYYSFPPQPKRTTYPPNDGFACNPETITMQPGEQFDRIRGTTGVFGAEPGTSLPQRSLPPTNPGIPLRIYEVQKPITGVLKGITAPFYNQPGGGVQYKFPSSIEKMLNDGFIKELIK